MEGIIGYSTAPLRLSIILGCVTAVAAVLYLLWTIIEKLVWGIAVPGYPTIIVLILLIGGLQMIMLGIIGEYIGRIYIEGKRRPIYIAKEYVSYDKEN